MDLLQGPVARLGDVQPGEEEEDHVGSEPDEAVVDSCSHLCQLPFAISIYGMEFGGGGERKLAGLMK